MITSVGMEPHVKISISTQVESMQEKFQTKILNTARTHYIEKGFRRFENMRAIVRKQQNKEAVVKEFVSISVPNDLESPS